MNFEQFKADNRELLGSLPLTIAKKADASLESYGKLYSGVLRQRTKLAQVEKTLPKALSIKTSINVPKATKLAAPEEVKKLEDEFNSILLVYQQQGHKTFVKAQKTVVTWAEKQANEVLTDFTKDVKTLFFQQAKSATDPPLPHNLSEADFFNQHVYLQNQWYKTTSKVIQYVDNAAEVIRTELELSSRSKLQDQEAKRNKGTDPLSAGSQEKTTSKLILERLENMEKQLESKLTNSLNLHLGKGSKKRKRGKHSHRSKISKSNVSSTKKMEGQGKGKRGGKRKLPNVASKTTSKKLKK